MNHALNHFLFRPAQPEPPLQLELPQPPQLQVLLILLILQILQLLQQRRAPLELPQPPLELPQPPLELQDILQRQGRDLLQGLRRRQFVQELKAFLACPGGLSLNHLSSLLFLLVLSALALALWGWFIFLGLVLTILAYLLLVILPESPQNVEPCSNPGVPGRNATFIRSTRSPDALAAFLLHVAVLAANERIHRVASLATRCMDSGRNPASYGFTRLFRTRF